MKLKIQQVEHIAKLARLGLLQEEKDIFAKELTIILDYVDQLQKVDTQNSVPISQITGLSNVMRDDIARQYEPHDELIRCAPALSEGHIKVPSVF